MKVKLLILLLLCSGTLFAQTRFDYFYLEAEKSRLAGDYASAKELYQHCLDINPNAAETVYNLGLMTLFLRQDSVEMGINMLKKACELDSCNPWYQETLATIYLNARRTSAAIPYLEKLAKLQANRTDVLSQLGSIYRDDGHTDKAIEVLNRIEMQEGKSVQLSMEKFNLYMSKEEEDSAFHELQSLCDEFPHDLNYRVMMANQYQMAGHLEKAMEIYNEVKQKDAHNLNLLLAMMTYYRSTEDNERFVQLRDSLLYDEGSSSDLRVTLMRDYIDEAIQDTLKRDDMLHAFDSLLSLPQKDAQLLMLKAAYLTYIKAGDDKVTELMKRVLDIEPGNQMALWHLLQYYAPKNNMVAVEDICRKGVNYHPEELAYAYYLGVSLFQQDKLKEAAEVFQQGLRTKTEEARPALVSDMYSVLGDLYYQEKKPLEAFAAYDSALVYVDDNISCLNNYAYYLSLRNEQLDKAEEMSYRTIKAEPDNITYLDTYAWILFMKEDFTNARIYIDRVVKPNLSDEELLKVENLQGNLIEHAGDIYAECGSLDTALRYWNLALRKKDGTCTPLVKKKIKKKRYIK
ncbi:MAG: tetratricopeptide repeat protein [Bacteroidaceae bacterium]|nr:tetratricopeptide repeat protein [Bacteroidaceae bacterium]